MSGAQAIAGGAAMKRKLVLIGDSGCGKSSIVVRLCKEEFVSTLHSTVGSSFFKYVVDLNDASGASDIGSVGNQPGGGTGTSGGGGGASAGPSGGSGSGGNNHIHLDIWDTAGQERFKSLARMYYRGAAAILVVYDITNVDTFERAKLWVKELSAQMQAVITVVGNKTDLAHDRAVPSDECAAFCAEAGVHHAECSAKTGEGVKQIFHQIAVKLAAQAPAAPAAGTVRAAGNAMAGGQQPKQKKDCPC